MQVESRDFLPPPRAVPPRSSVRRLSGRARLERRPGRRGEPRVGEAGPVSPSKTASFRPAGRQSREFWLKPLAPFRLDLTVWALRRRPANLIDCWDGQTYRRVLVLGDRAVEAAVTQHGPPDSSRLRVRLSGARLPVAENAAKAVLERVLGSRLDLSPFYRLAGADAKLGPLAERFRGLKPPRFPSLFEALANAIACQQMSLSLGILLLSRLAERFGLNRQKTVEAAHSFPPPGKLARLEPEVFREMGFSRQKGRALIALAREFRDHSEEWERIERLDNDTAFQRLLELRGVGRWSAEYALLRGSGRLDVYPGDDVGARNNLTRWLGLRKPLDYKGVRRLTAKWQPYAGLVYFHLLLDRLEKAGLLN